MTGIVEGASEAVKVWGPHAMTGVETPPDRPGLAVIKRVSADRGRAGRHADLRDRLSQHGQHADQGRLDRRQPVAAPRIRQGDRAGPKEPFTTAVNRVGATELRWELPGVLAPGARLCLVPGDRAVMCR